MQIPINISSPILVSGQYFKIEYSTDGISWTFDGYQSTNNFITNYAGFVNGVTYYFRISLIRSLSPFVECDPVVTTFYMPEDIYCLNFTIQLVLHNDIWYIEVTHVTPSPFVSPCSWEVHYGTTQPYTITTFTTLPNPLMLPTGSGTNYIYIYALDCDGNRKLCQSAQLTQPATPNPPIPPPLDPPPLPCTPASVSASIQYINGWKLVLSLTPSIPAASTYTIAYSQCDTPTSGLPEAGGTITVNATGQNPQLIYIPISPNYYVPHEKPTYCGSVTNGCGMTVTFTVTKT